MLSRQSVEQLSGELLRVLVHPDALAERRTWQHLVGGAGEMVEPRLDRRPLRIPFRLAYELESLQGRSSRRLHPVETAPLRLLLREGRQLLQLLLDSGRGRTDERRLVALLRSFVDGASAEQSERVVCVVFSMIGSASWQGLDAVDGDGVVVAEVESDLHVRLLVFVTVAPLAGCSFVQRSAVTGGGHFLGSGDFGVGVIIKYCCSGRSFNLIV